MTNPLIGESHYRAQGSITVIAVPDLPPGLAGFYDNVGITDDHDTYVGDFDGGAGHSYSRQELRAKGLRPGATVTHDGITFTWPHAAAGQPENVVTLGQPISFTGSGSRLGILGAATHYCFTGSGCSNGTATGTVTVTYTDGSISRARISVGDWWANRAAPGSDILVTTPDWNEPVGVSNPHPVSVYATSIPIDPAKTVELVTLPDVGSGVDNGVALHIFALGVWTPTASGRAGGVGASRYTVNRNGDVRVRVACPSLSLGGCRGTIGLDFAHGTHGAVIGQAMFTLAPGRARRIAVDVTRHTQILLRRHRRLRAIAVVRFDDGAGRQWRSTTSITLLAPTRRRGARRPQPRNPPSYLVVVRAAGAVARKALRLIADQRIVIERGTIPGTLDVKSTAAQLSGDTEIINAQPATATVRITLHGLTLVRSLLRYRHTLRFRSPPPLLMSGMPRRFRHSDEHKIHRELVDEPKHESVPLGEQVGQRLVTSFCGSAPGAAP